MAQRIEQFPDAPVQSNYPWDEWFDGSVWELTPGEDFKGKPATFRASAVAQAARRGPCLAHARCVVSWRRDAHPLKQQEVA